MIWSNDTTFIYFLVAGGALFLLVLGMLDHWTSGRTEGGSVAASEKESDAGRGDWLTLSVVVPLIFGICAYWGRLDRFPFIAGPIVACWFLGRWFYLRNKRK